MGKFIDMTGWKMWDHGVPDSRLTIIGFAGSQDNRALWNCQCSCGGTVTASGTHIRRGDIRSCGCLRIECTSDIGKNNKLYNDYDITSHSYGIGWAANSGIQFEFDLDDYNAIKEHCWSTCTDHYGYTRLETQIEIDGKYKRISMAQLLTGTNDIDHADKNPMNNKRNNFRMASRCQQTANTSLRSNNTSGVTGVYWNTRESMWVASITYNKKKIHLGTFADKTSAIKARLKAEQKYFQEFAPQQHLYAQYGLDISYEGVVDR